MSKIRPEHLLERGKLGASWLTAKQDDDGIYQNTDDVGCYYKSPFSLVVNGHTRTAVKCLTHVMKRYMTPDGDFMNSPEIRTGGTYTVKYCQLYPNGWLLRSAMALRWFDVGRKLFDFMLTCRDADTGGFRSKVGNESPIMDSNSTAISVLCCILAGRGDLAVAGGDFLVRMLKEQPDPAKYYVRWMPGEGLITKYDAKEAPFYMIDASLPGQYYWQAGLPMCVLAQLYQYTGQERFLKGAIGYYDFLTGCHSDVTCTPAAGKVSWGSSLLYRLTKDERYRATSEKVLEYLLDIQQKDGSMLLKQYKTVEEQPLKITYDCTAEFSCWLADSAIELM